MSPMKITVRDEETNEDTQVELTANFCLEKAAECLLMGDLDDAEIAKEWRHLAEAIVHSGS